MYRLKNVSVLFLLGGVVFDVGVGVVVVGVVDDVVGWVVVFLVGFGFVGGGSFS